MKIRAFLVGDDVIETFFADEAPNRPLADVGEFHGKLLFDGKCGTAPASGDLVVIDGEEYAVVFRSFFLEEEGSVCELILVEREFGGEGQS